MYYYIVDPHKLGLEKFEQLHVELQGLLSEFNISGEIVRVTSLHSISDLVENASHRGVKTLVACGNDDTFNLMLAALKGREFTLGFIPLGEGSYLSTILGVNNVAQATKAIAARRIVHIDMARLGNLHFISYLQFGVMSKNLAGAGFWQGLKLLSSDSQRLQVRIDNSYTVELDCLGGLVVNTRSTSSKTQSIANPTDGSLDLLVLEKLSRFDILRFKTAIIQNRLEELPHPTVIKCKKLEFLQPRGYPLTMSGRVVTKFPATVEMDTTKLRLIVGKNRTF